MVSAPALRFVIKRLSQDSPHLRIGLVSDAHKPEALARESAFSQ